MAQTKRQGKKRQASTKRSERNWTVAAVQMTSTEDVSRNLAQAERLIRRAATPAGDRAGARLIAIPENFAYLRAEGQPVAFRTSVDGEVVGRFRELAAELGCWLLLGSIPEEIPRSKRIHNTSVLIDDRGRIASTYRKVHLFDIDIKDGVTFFESKTVKPGDTPVVADTPLGRLGLTICYDLRFPEIYRQLVFDGAQVLFVPAAFTAYTGPPHWLALLRARAIENQCWVVAPAQFGQHSPERSSHGESVVIDPWGTVVARKPRGIGFVSATIDLDRVDAVRRGLPCLQHTHKELFTPPVRRRGSR